MAQTTKFTHRDATPALCKWHAAGACRHADGLIRQGQEVSWSRKTGEKWHTDCPSEAADRIIVIKWTAPCAHCGAPVPKDTQGFFSPSSHKIWHTACNEAYRAASAAGSSSSEQLEAALRASLAANEAKRAASMQSPPAVPVPVPAMLPMPAAKPTASFDAALVPEPASALEAAIRAIAASVAPQAAPMDESRVIELIAAYAPKIPTVRVEVAAHGEVTAQFDGEHKNFPALLRKCSARGADGKRLNIWLAGPAGTGKTTAARRVADALSVPYYANGSIQDPTQLVGYVSPVTGQYMSTAFRRAFEGGGVMLLDEIDASDPNALLVLNQALANTHYMFPDGALIERHDDFLCICAANTYGLGGTHDYVGRMKQDAAFLDRFVSQDWPIDEDMERRLAGNDAWCDAVQHIRASAKRSGVRVVISPRASYYGAALLAAGATWEEAETATMRRGMTDEQWTALKGGA